jgi:hypothetical protein
MHGCMSALLALEIQTGNVNCHKTGFTERRDLIVVRYSVTKSELQSNNRFSFQDKVAKVGLIH